MIEGEAILTGCCAYILVPFDVVDGVMTKCGKEKMLDDMSIN